MINLMPIIETMEHRWMRAWAGRDPKELKALTARKFRLVMGSRPAAILDATSWLDAAATRFRCTSYRFGDIYVRDLGSVAVFAAQLTIKASMDDQDWSGEYWVTDIWQKSRVRRRWRLIERVLSRPEPNGQIPAGIQSLQLWRRG
ncbi:nuclear transport factor 2 family protein [Sphingomonas xanthus]|uniref:Nuclear transport factor 2 family protein n=1 Tax=Sphingomonas xanthus TaxID=2594473 RepID=A0A516IQU9_9SPHN|nr:nuclear transport factor 2 family protein [Sphingomonas xanthus]QDP19275.1 nuclear transport factor 2 family protein [Sphingomonas xanthus]